MPYTAAAITPPQLTSVGFDTINGLSPTPPPSPSHKISNKKLLLKTFKVKSNTQTTINRNKKKCACYSLLKSRYKGPLGIQLPIPDIIDYSSK